MRDSEHSNKLSTHDQEKSNISADKAPALMFPYHAGPPLRFAGVNLLYFGKIAASMPAWLMPEVIDSFVALTDALSGRAHPLAGLLYFVRSAFEMAQEFSIAEMNNLDILRKEDRVNFIITVYPGNLMRYEELATVPKETLIKIKAIIEGDIGCGLVAATEFIWRVYECFLEFDGNIGKIITYLSEKARVAGDPFLLISECFVNRFTITQGIRLFSDSRDVVGLLGDLGKPFMQPNHQIVQKEKLDELKSEELSYMFFDYLIRPYLPVKLEGDRVSFISRLMSDKAEELEALRQKCRYEAWQLVLSPPSEQNLPGAAEQALTRMQEEVTSIVTLDSNTFRKLIKGFTENQTVWASVGSLLYSLVGALPPVIPASLTVTAFSILGANALKASREQNELLRKSPWSFIYHLSRPLGVDTIF